MKEDVLSKFCMFFNRMPGEWWLTGKTLAHFLQTREIKFFGEEPSVCITLTSEQFFSQCVNRGVPLNKENGLVAVYFPGDKIYVKTNCEAMVSNYVIAPKEDKKKHARRRDLTSNGLWRRKINRCSPMTVQLPYKYGTYLDESIPLWWIDGGVENHKYKKLYFTSERKRVAYELLGEMVKSGENAGIKDAMFLGFGALLGYIMVGDIPGNDDDTDICILSDRITTDSAIRYVEDMNKPKTINGIKYPHGLGECNWRMCDPRDDTGMPLWVSVGHKKQQANGVKSCNWFMFEHSGFMWHSKGSKWVGKVGDRSSSKSKAACLGQPVDTLKDLIEIDFHGVKINMPKKAGTCVDWWYPGWVLDGEGSSAHNRVLIVPDWNNKKSWKIL